MDAFQQHWGLYFLREICLIFVINCKMIFCSSSSLMPVDECTLHKCTSGWKAGFFSLLSRCSGVVSSFCWSCLFVLLVCWARLGWVPGVERIWIDLCQRRERGGQSTCSPRGLAFPTLSEQLSKFQRAAEWSLDHDRDQERWAICIQCETRSRNMGWPEMRNTSAGYSWRYFVKHRGVNYNHCQRHSGPMGWVLGLALACLHQSRVISQGHTNIDQTSAPKSRPSLSFKTLTKIQLPLELTQIAQVRSSTHAMSMSNHPQNETNSWITWRW